MNGNDIPVDGKSTLVLFFQTATNKRKHFINCLKIFDSSSVFKHKILYKPCKLRSLTWSSLSCNSNYILTLQKKWKQKFMHIHTLLFIYYYSSSVSDLMPFNILSLMHCCGQATQRYTFSNKKTHTQILFHILWDTHFHVYKWSRWGKIIKKIQNKILHVHFFSSFISHGITK